MLGLRSADLGDGRYSDASLELSLTAWFWAAHLMGTHSNGMSALQLKGQLGLSYRATWLLTQKLRRSMVDPEREPLEELVEIDQTEIPIPRHPELLRPQ